VNKARFGTHTDNRLTRGTSHTLHQAFSTLSFRILPAIRLPDAVLFQELLDAQQRPSGLHVAAMLGSTFALAQIDPAGRDLMVHRAPPFRRMGQYGRRAEPGIYDGYLETLSALFMTPESSAPRFMRSPLWAVKSCQTALAGWAQLRHTFTLQAKMNVHYFGLSSIPPGFVEPNPEFFQRMLRLVTKTVDDLEASGCFVPNRDSSREDMQAEVDMGKALLEQFIADPAKRTDPTFLSSLSRLERRALGVWSAPEGNATEQKFREHLQMILENLEGRLAAAQNPAPISNTSEGKLAAKWKKLQRITSSLNNLTYKQLAGKPWDETDERFLKSYGEQMAGIMGYDGNSWLSPRDDAPRWAEVCAYPQEGKSLAVGVGRPRKLYVLYPWNGMEILCVGSVMQYYEYDADKRLTDPEWLQLLDSPAAPALPAWLAPHAPPPNLQNR
jgi:hypothetical protein